MSTRPSSHARVDEELERKRFTLKCQSAASAHWSAIAAALGCLYSDFGVLVVYLLAQHECEFRRRAPAGHASSLRSSLNDDDTTCGR
jgi:hypothetical protein